MIETHKDVFLGQEMRKEIVRNRTEKQTESEHTECIKYR